MIRRSSNFVAIAALAIFATAAHAHALLKKAVPPVGGTISQSPKQIRLQFSEGVEPRFSSVALSTGSGAKVPLGKASVDPTDPEVLIVPVAAVLPAGAYTVVWHAVSVDTHRTQGSFTFTLAR